MHRGYIKLWRKFSETSFFKKPNCVHLAVHLLLDSNHEDKKFIFNNQEMICKRGQVVTGLYELSTSTGLSVQSVRTSLEILANTGFLTSQSTNRFRIVSICKYDQYQERSTSQSTNTQQSGNNLVTNKEQQTRTISTSKNDKNDKNKSEFILPEWVDTKTFQDFKDMRSKIRKPMTQRAIELTIQALERLRTQGNDPKLVLEQSIQKSWQGVFELKADFSNSKNTGCPPVLGKYDGLGEKA